MRIRGRWEGEAREELLEGTHRRRCIAVEARRCQFRDSAMKEKLSASERNAHLVGSNSLSVAVEQCSPISRVEAEPTQEGVLAAVVAAKRRSALVSTPFEAS
jgi:hypothetical protein